MLIFAGEQTLVKVAPPVEEDEKAFCINENGEDESFVRFPKN